MPLTPDFAPARERGRDNGFGGNALQRFHVGGAHSEFIQNSLGRVRGGFFRSAAQTGSALNDGTVE